MEQLKRRPFPPYAAASGLSVGALLQPKGVPLSDFSLLTGRSKASLWLPVLLLCTIFPRSCHLQKPEIGETEA